MAVIIGTDGEDSANSALFRGTQAADTIDGLGGPDTIFGNGGDDVLRGGDGDNDYLYAGVFTGTGTIPGFLNEIDVFTYDGADLYDGGPGGNDTHFASYAGSTTVVIDLTAGTGQGGNAQGDRFVGIEDVAILPFGSPGTARLVGNAVGNIIAGGSGTDTIEGRGGDFDLLVGGDGFDTASYRLSPAGVTVDLALTESLSGGSLTPAHQQVSAGDANGDIVVQFEALVGSAFADILSGDRLDNRLEGLAGNDVLQGRDGNDTYVFGRRFGADVVRDAGGAQDRIESPLTPRATSRVGDDLLLDFGSDGTVLVDDHFRQVAVGAIVTRPAGQVEQLFNSTNGQTLVLATGTTGGPAAGIITGSEADEVLDGAGGDDLLFAGAGADIVIGGEGDDLLVGGKGPDVFVIRPGDGDDTILDFRPKGKNADRLDLSAFGFERAEDVLANLARSEAGAVLSLGPDQTITFERMSPAKLGVDNLILEA